LVDAHGAGSLMAGFPGDIRVTCRLPRLEGKGVLGREGLGRIGVEEGWWKKKKKKKKGFGIVIAKRLD